MSALRIGCRVAVVAALACAGLAGPSTSEGWQAADQAALDAEQAQQEAALNEKIREERRKRIEGKAVQPLVALVDAAIAGDADTPMDFGVEWSHDVFQARSGQAYIPYTLAVPQADLEADGLVMYVRLVHRGAAPVADATAPGDETTTAAPEPAPAFDLEDAHIVGLRKPLDPRDPYRFSRALVIDGGEYDVYVALREENEESAAPKTSVLKYALTVPDVSSGLATSSMLLNPRMTQLAAPLGWEEQETRPYALGSVELAPSWNRTIAKSDTLSLFLFIYNAQLSPDSGKPDVLVEYDFYTVSATGERFFNKTNPQAYNAQTMPPQWDAALGHQLNVGLNGVPLTSFPLGSYRLEVKVTDNMSGASLVRDVTFDLTAGS